MINCYSCSPVWGWRNSPPIRSGLRVIGQPEGEQITLAEAKLHLRIDDEGGSPTQPHPDDTLIQTLIVAAREWCENDTGRALVPQTFELVTSAWPARSFYAIENTNELPLPMSPISSITSVTYLDGGGASQVLAASAYTLDNWSEPSWLYSAVDTSWPTVQAVRNAITVRYQAGYTLPNASPDDRPLPKSIKAAMLLIVGHLYENREETTELKLMSLPLGASSLLDRWRLRLGIA